MIKKNIFMFLLAMLLIIPLSVNADEKEKPVYGNVWESADGKQYFTCPVMKKEAKVGHEKGYSDIDGVRYLHCCPPCQGPFRADHQKYLDNLALPANISKVDDSGTKYFIDPVNGKEKELKRDSEYCDYEGKRYFFAKAKNLKKFKTSPEKYVR